MKRKYIDLGSRLYNYFDKHLTNTDLQAVWLCPQQFNHVKGRKITIDAGGNYNEAYTLMEIASKLFNTRNIDLCYDYQTQDYQIYVNCVPQEFIENLIVTTEWENNYVRS